MIPIVAVFIHNNEGKYLIQKVAESKGGYYATTAGHVQSGEMDFTISMQRELKEELGLSVTQSELKLLRIRRYGYKFTLRRLRKLIVEINSKTKVAAQQAELLSKTLDGWLDGNRQIDDILIGGYCIR